MKYYEGCEEITREKTRDFQAKMKLGYDFKKAYAARRAWEFYNHPEVAGRCYVAVGGLDSITLFLFLRSIGIDVPATSVSMLEDRSIQRVHKALGVKGLLPVVNQKTKRPYNKVEVIREYGFPVLSKEIAGKIYTLQHPTEKNATVRHAIMTGETGAYGGYRKGTRMKMAQKWLEIFGGPENEREGTDYKTAPFQVSELCCYYLKEMLSLSAHKFGGPKGVGVLYCRNGIILDPLLFGGGQERGNRPGTENTPGIVAMAVAMREACENMESAAAKTRELRDRLIRRIKEIPDSYIHGSLEKRLPGNINCSFAGVEGEAVVIMLDLAGVCASSGSACTSGTGEPSHVLTAMGLSRKDAYGAIRITLAETNTEAEVDYIGDQLAEIVRKLRG